MENILKALKNFRGGIQATADKAKVTEHSVTRALRGEWEAPHIVEAAKEVINERMKEVQELLAKEKKFSEAA